MSFVAHFNKPMLLVKIPVIKYDPSSNQRGSQGIHGAFLLRVSVLKTNKFLRVQKKPDVRDILVYITILVL